jgi:hypothetical protein
MILSEFLSFKKFDIEDDITNNPTSFTVDSLRQNIIDSVNLLRPIRSSSQRTAKAIKGIMEKHMIKREVGGHYDESNNQIPDTWVYENTIESNILKNWILSFCKQNLSYNYAYNAILSYINRDSAILIELNYIEENELMDLIKKDEEEESKANSTVKKDDILIEVDNGVKYTVETSHGPVEGNSKELVDILAKAISEMPEIELYDYSLKDEEIDKYITNRGIAKFYGDITNYEVDELILKLEGRKITEILMIIDSICRLIEENHTKVTFVTNKIKSLIKEIKTKEIDNLLIFQGVREWFKVCELEDTDLGVTQIFSFIHNYQVHYMSAYYLFGYHRPELQTFNDYLNSTWMGEFMITNAEIVANEKLNSNSVNQKNNSDVSSDNISEETINNTDNSVKKQLSQDFAAITRPLSTSFPSFRTYAAIKLKKQPAQLKKALLDDFNEFKSMVGLLPNNEPDRQKMIDQLESFSVQYPDWNFEVEESKKIVSAVKDGRRDDIIFNTICKLKDLKDDHSYRNLITDLDNYIDTLEAGNQKIKLKSNNFTKRNQTNLDIINPSKIQNMTSFKNQNSLKNENLDIYLEEVENLSDSIHDSWMDAWDEESNDINIDILKKNIYAYGEYIPQKAIIKKKEPKTSLKFKVQQSYLQFISKIVGFGELTFEDGYDDRIQLALGEIKENLFGLNYLIDKKAYANIILRSINQIDIYNQGNDSWEYPVNYDLLFTCLNDTELITDKKNKELEKGILVLSLGYDLQVRFAKHLYFITELTQLLKCFEIDIFQLAHDVNLRISLINTDKTGRINSSITDENFLSDEFDSNQEKEKIVDFTINTNKYDPDKIYKLCTSKKVFKCEKDIFDAWLVYGTGSLTGKIKWLYQNGNKAQLCAFMNKITGKDVMPTQINKSFDVKKVDSNNKQDKLNDDLMQILILCPIKKEK